MSLAYRPGKKYGTIDRCMGGETSTDKPHRADPLPSPPERLRDAVNGDKHDAPTLERKDKKDQVEHGIHERLAGLMHAPTDEINHHGITLSKALDQVQEQRQAMEPSTIMHEAIARRDWVTVVKVAWQMLFRPSTERQGLGFLVGDGLKNINDQQKAALLRQMDGMDPKGWKDRMKISLIRGETERALHRGGYDPVEAADIKETVKVEDKNITVRGLITRRSAGPESTHVLDALDKGDIIGALPLDAVLPQGCYVSFDKNGFPIHVSPDQREQAKKVRLYLRKRENQSGPDDVNARIEFLQGRLRDGDIIFMSKGGRETTVEKMFSLFGRATQSKNKEQTEFHAVHVGFVKNGNIVHIRARGRQEHTLDDLVKREGYTTLSVGRLPDPRQATALLRAADAYSIDRQHYNVVGAVQRASRWTRENVQKVVPSGLANAEISTDKSCICTDPVKRGLEQAGMQGLKDGSALEFFERLPIAYSVDFH
ncbi:MAG: hypothetical protein Greene041619_1064 [Candidatus Peregrinibacteria bacterium Greene0416_19]|nr:MAG: hypothetical protein Greene041619_1064 [Candidatus Peregrinibacteria bacterium Greene0416_19]